MRMGDRHLVLPRRLTIQREVPKPPGAAHCSQKSFRKRNGYQEQILRQETGVGGVYRPKDNLALH